MAFDRSKFIGQFKIETREHLEKMNLGLLKLEKHPDDRELLNAMMREAHTIKGSSTMMGYKRIADIAHRMEDGLERAAKGELALKKPHFDMLFKAIDAIGPLLEDKVTWPDAGVAAPFVDTICRSIADLFAGAPVSAETAEPQRAPQAPAEERRTDLPPASRPGPVDLAETTIRVDIDTLDDLMNIAGELLISKIRLNEIVKACAGLVESESGQGRLLGPHIADLQLAGAMIDRLTADMQNEVMKVRMVPISHLFNLFPRAMRDLAAAKGKEIEFVIEGGDTQLDKAIIDGLKDPLLHLLRNALDHGIEGRAERAAHGKPAIGKITLSAYRQGSQVIVAVADDGGGIDVESVKRRVLDRGFMTPEQVAEADAAEMYRFLFLPGFSTSETVTETSGRGVGLDVVREHIARLKGMVEIESVRWEGTRFILRLPLTLAITESLLVAAGSDRFAIPVDTIVETGRIAAQDIRTVESKDVVMVRDRILPVVRLNDIFGLPRKGIFEKRYLPLIIVQSVEKRIGILVDEVCGRQEIVSKRIGEPLANVMHVAGATILGSGRVVLIVDIPSVIASAEGGVVRKAASVRPAAPAVRKKKKKTILLAEDVMSTAMLEKNILESVGYSVVIARDGQEALDRAAQERFDLVITDVLMPRMDGFELVTRLRRESAYKDIPIVIVTTRESDDDKQRGLEAGADAYILKKDFTSEVLLDTLERLIG